MPELPEVETTRRGIEPWLQQQRIEQIVIRQPRLRWPVEDSIQALTGQTISAITRRAKYILVETAAGTAIWHLGMSGSLRLVEPGTEPGKHDHIDWIMRSEEHTSELQSREKLVCRLLLPRHADRRALHPVPTRRSSDLGGGFHSGADRADHQRDYSPGQIHSGGNRGWHGHLASGHVGFVAAGGTRHRAGET